MYRDRYFEIERLLDEALGTEDSDGSGEGIVADVRLAIAKAEKRGAVKALRSEAARWRASSATGRVPTGDIAWSLDQAAGRVESGEVTL